MSLSLVWGMIFAELPLVDTIPSTLVNDIRRASGSAFSGCAQNFVLTTALSLQEEMIELQMGLHEVFGWTQLLKNMPTYSDLMLELRVLVDTSMHCTTQCRMLEHMHQERDHLLEVVEEFRMFASRLFNTLSDLELN